jgi:glycyl-tRNA synthetase beta chain
MDTDLILEIGTEEIPAGFLANSAKKLKEITSQVLSDSNLRFDNITVYYTPRRLALRVEGIPDKQDDITEEFTGPPKSIALDKNGNPTKAALGFAKKFNTEFNKLKIINNEKGQFLGFVRKIRGRKSNQILKEIIPDIILKIPFPKSMRWGTSNISFARPIRWILCLL